MIMQLGRVLTILVVILALGFAATLIFTNLEAQNQYGALTYSVSKLSPEYDYSCDEPVYGLYVILSNNGSKAIADFSVSISNPLCKGAVPPLTNVLLPSQHLGLYLYSTQENGTLTVSGNNTMVEISF